MGDISSPRDDSRTSLSTVTLTASPLYITPLTPALYIYTTFVGTTPWIVSITVEKTVTFETSFPVSSEISRPTTPSQPVNSVVLSTSSSINATSPTSTTSETTDGGGKGGFPTTTSPGSSSTNTSLPSKGSSGLKAGAAAGLAIGMLIAGAILALAIAWLLLRNRKRKAPELVEKRAGSNYGAAAYRDAPKGVATVSVVEDFLPQPLEDGVVASDLSQLCTRIKDHVDYYYHNDSVHAGDVPAIHLDRAGTIEAPLNDQQLVSFLLDPSTRHYTLHYCIAWVVLSRIRWMCEPDTSLLPPELAKCIANINTAGEDQNVRNAILSKWRALTAKLISATYTRPGTFSSADSRTTNISKALYALDPILKPFAKTRETQDRASNLENNIIRFAASFALKLFSQPTSWKFDWETHEQGVMVFFPGLKQTKDENGQKLPHVRLLLETQCIRI